MDGKCHNRNVEHANSKCYNSRRREKDLDVVKGCETKLNIVPGSAGMVGQEIGWEISWKIFQMCRNIVIQQGVREKGLVFVECFLWIM